MIEEPAASAAAGPERRISPVAAAHQIGLALGTKKYRHRCSCGWVGNDGFRHFKDETDRANGTYRGY